MLRLGFLAFSIQTDHDKSFPSPQRKIKYIKEASVQIKNYPEKTLFYFLLQKHACSLPTRTNKEKRRAPRIRISAQARRLILSKV